MNLVILILGTGLQRLWLRHCTRLSMCLLLLVAFLPPWRTKDKLLWISYDFRMSMHKTNFNEQRFYELIPVVRQPGRTFLECCATRALKERVKTLDSLNNDEQVLLIA